MDTLLFVIGIIGNVISILLFLSPILTFWRIVKSQSTEDFEPAPYVVTLLCCSLSVYYDVIKPGEYLVASINGIGVVMEFIYVFLFLIYAPSSARVKTLILVGVLDVGFFGGVVLFLQLVVEKSFHIMVMGVLSASLNVAMYASPLAVMKTVITTKSVEYMPFLLSLFLTLNGGVWTLYAIVDRDVFIGLPAGLGLAFGAIQVVLYMMYMNTEASKQMGHPDKISALDQKLLHDGEFSQPTVIH